MDGVSLFTCRLLFITIILIIQQSWKEVVFELQNKVLEMWYVNKGDSSVGNRLECFDTNLTKCWITSMFTKIFGQINNITWWFRHIMVLRGWTGCFNYVYHVSFNGVHILPASDMCMLLFLCCQLSFWVFFVCILIKPLKKVMRELPLIIFVSSIILVLSVMHLLKQQWGANNGRGCKAYLGM